MTFFYGGTIAKFVEEGCKVKVITVTHGECSTVDIKYLNNQDQLRTDLKKEHQQALKLVGVSDFEQYDGFANHNLFLDKIKIKLRERIIFSIREFRPDTIISFDPANVFEENSDHRILGSIVIEAASFAAYPLEFSDQITKHGLKPHFVSKVLLTPTKSPDTYVNIGGSFLDKKIAAGAAYKTQLDLMVTESIQRLKNIGMSFEMLHQEPGKIWAQMCTLMAIEVGKETQMEKQHKSLGQKEVHKITHAESFRMVYLGAIEKIRALLPAEINNP